MNEEDSATDRTPRSPLPDSSPLIGRDPECEMVLEVLEDARAGSGRSLYFEGPPGVGKTALLRWAMSVATAFRVIHCRARPASELFPYSGVVDLLEPLGELVANRADTQVLDLLRGSRGPDRAELPSTIDPLGVGAALLKVLAEIAESVPVVVVIDDAHWLDQSSAAALAFMAHLSVGDSIAILGAGRDNAPSPWREKGLPVHRLGGLSNAAATRLVAGRMTPDVTRQVVEAANGNPLLILAACEQFTPGQREGREPVDQLLAMPEQLEYAYTGRLDALDDEARVAVLVVASDEQLDRAMVLAVCECLGASSPEAAVAELERVGLLRVEGSALCLHHPLLGTAAYDRADPAERRDTHAAIASFLRRDADLERRAWHVARSVEGPDARAATLLCEAAERAIARGDQSAAARCFERSAQLTSDLAERVDRLGAAGDALAAAGRSRESMAVFETALQLAHDASTRVSLLVRRMVPMSQAGGDDAMADEMERQVVEIAAVDPDVAAKLAVSSAFPAFAAGKLSRAGSFLERARSLSSNLDPVTDLVASGLEAIVAVFRGEVSEARPTLLQLAATPGIEAIEGFGEYVANALAWIDDFAVAEPLLDVVVALWRTRRAPGSLAFPMTMRAEVYWRMGRPLDARADADEARVLALAAGRALTAAYATCVLARAEATLGRVGYARELAIEALGIGERERIGFMDLYGRAALGYVELAAGRPADAIVHLEHAAAFARREGARLMTPAPWAPDLVEAYARVGRDDDARGLVRRLTSDAGSDPSVWTNGALARCRGLISDSGQLDAHFTAALAAFSELPTPLEQARTRLCWAERLHATRRPREGATQLELAAAEFDALHAKTWSAHARRGDDGPIPLDPAATQIESLTPREYQIAQLVARGATNPEVAAALFISRHTVEHHLSGVYRKLGVRSRTELARLFAAERH